MRTIKKTTKRTMPPRTRKWILCLYGLAMTACLLLLARYQAG